jgi:hypothetical protein
MVLGGKAQKHIYLELVGKSQISKEIASAKGMPILQDSE